MATSIERNTIKLLEQQRDALFAQQEQMKQQMGLTNNSNEFAFGGPAGQDDPLVGMGFPQDPNTGLTIDPSNYPMGDIQGAQQPTFGSTMQNFWQNNFAGGNWGDTANILGQLSPMFYNLGRGALEKPQRLDASKFYNKYEGRALGQLQQAQPYDISSQLANVTAGQNALTRNLTRAGSSSGGALRSNLLAGSAAATRQRGDIYAQKENIEGQRDIQRRQQLSQMYAGFGRDRSQIDFGVQQINDQNRAAQTRMLSQGFTDMSRFAQNQQLMGNQKERDAELRKLYPEIYDVVKFMDLYKGK